MVGRLTDLTQVKISLLKKADLPPYLEDLSFPLLENDDAYVVSTPPG